MGKNLTAQLKNIRDNKARWYGNTKVSQIFEYDVDNSEEDLDCFCKEADFVFNLAGVNRPKDEKEFMEGNFGFASTLLHTLEKHGNRCPVMLSSSIQATLEGRYAGASTAKAKRREKSCS